MEQKSANHWTKQEEIQEIVEEIAKELKLTPDIVLGVLNFTFDSIHMAIVKKTVKYFELPLWGRICSLKYVSRKARRAKESSAKNKRISRGGRGERMLTPEELAERGLTEQPTTFPSFLTGS